MRVSLPLIVFPPALIMVLALILMLAPGAPSCATTKDEMLDDPALEARARRMAREIRCVVCRSESVDESEAALAREFRLIIRERLRAGASDAEIRAYLSARYGDYVLLRPPLGAGTALLWISPLLFLLIGGALILNYRKGLHTDRH